MTPRHAGSSRAARHPAQLDIPRSSPRVAPLLRSAGRQTWRDVIDRR